MTEIQELDHDLEDIADILLECAERTIHRLKKKNSQVTWEECQDIANESLLKTCEAMVNSYKGEPVHNPCGFMIKTADLIMNNFRRKKRTRREMSLEFESNISELTPQKTTPLENKERRVRQGWKLSDTFREFVLFCENQGGSWLRIKETMERRFLGEEKEVTLQRMFLYGNSKNPSNLFDQDLSRGWEELVRIRNTHDVRNTVFDTTPKRRKEEKIDRPTGIGNRLPSSAALDDLLRVSEEISSLHSSASVHLLIVRDTSAFCPSRERVGILRHLQNNSAQFEQVDCPEDLLDVFFHCIERQCPFCDESQSLTENV